MFVEAGDGHADGAGAEADVFCDLGDGVWEGLLVSSAVPGLAAAQDQQDFEFGAVELWEMIQDCERNPDTAGLGCGGPDRGIGVRMLHKGLSAVLA